jgi:hypothetical protein
MINYPNKALKALNNNNITRFWEIIKADLVKITEEIKKEK